ncbi:MAG: AMP-binding protein [Flavobacteriales bacterium]|nr:AMP-binding protein [Flavobacteriales bacterium]
MIGGDVFPLAHARKAFDTLGPGVLVNGYGPTEDSVMCTTFTVQDRTELDTPLPIGKPLVNAPTYVLDDKQRPVRIGQKGRTLPGRTGGGDRLLAAARAHGGTIPSRPVLQHPGARMYRTGDQVRWRADGNLEFIGQVDDRIKIRGFRVELGELEAALNDLPTVKDKVAIALAEGGSEKQIFLYVVPANGASPEDPGTPALGAGEDAPRGARSGPHASSRRHRNSSDSPHQWRQTGQEEASGTAQVSDPHAHGIRRAPRPTGITAGRHLGQAP